jgi:hypothetical protein
MRKMSLTVLVILMALVMPAPSPTQAQDATPLKIGLITDLSAVCNCTASNCKMA